MLIVFIAIVLVAGVASKVLINAATDLQKQTEKTGSEAIQEASSAFKMIDTFFVNYEDLTEGEVEEVNLKVGIYGGSEPQDLHQTVIQVRSADEEVNLEAAGDVDVRANDESYAWEPIYKEENDDQDDSIVGVGDLYKLTINLIAVDDENEEIIGSLGPQETLDIQIIPKHGTSIYEEITTPSTLSGSSIITSTKEAVQLDFSSIYDSDTVVTGSEADDGIQDSDGLFDAEGAFITQAIAEDYDADDPNGLPNDGYFSSDSNHPEVELDWSGENTWKAESVGEQVTAGVPDENYDEIHIFTSAGGAGAGSPAKYTITLNYADGTTTTSSEFTTPDWFGSAPSNGYYLIDGMDRWYSGSYDDADAAAIFGHSVDADETKTLESVTIDITQMDADVFGFFGGSAKTTS